MWPLIVSGGLCSWLQIDSNWTDSSSIKDIKHPVICFWSDLTGQRKTFQAFDTRWQDLLLSTLPNHPPILLEIRHPYMFPKRSSSFISPDPPNPPTLHLLSKILSHCCSHIELVFFLQADWFILPTVCLTLWLWCMDMCWFWFNYIHPHFIHEANLVQAPFLSSSSCSRFVFFYVCYICELERWTVGIDSQTNIC